MLDSCASDIPKANTQSFKKNNRQFYTHANTVCFKHSQYLTEKNNKSILQTAQLSILILLVRLKRIPDETPKGLLVPLCSHFIRIWWLLTNMEIC